ncbi:MAG TPA: winged helix-turn-helix domain-containing protein [Pseudorhodoplanes sp.]|nr:winged helix-turn-helix domain-containing protein [Pseudorhodoplanes sp.]HWV53242.1 winged helix-turn-helix domain-containing protein [Pseudorhodoplanes sp.]
MQYIFSNCALDLDRRELTRAAEPVAVGPQVFDLLAYLVRNRDRVVSKDDLLDSIWGGRIVSESTLTSHINAVRKAIGDSGEEQRLIRTVPRKGFRFVGDVTETSAADSEGGSGTEASRANEPVPALTLPDSPSIAVLPFQNWSGDPEQDYFADGMVEDIITALSRIRWLFVIARNSSFTYKGRAVDVKQVGRDLGVRYVLEGSVRKAGTRVRITGQLVDAATGTHLWAERFDSTLDDIFALQDQVAASVVGALAPTLESAEIERAKRKPTENLRAYDYYLRGMASFHRSTKEATADALQLFGTAIEFDPDFAPPYAMAAWCYFWRKINGWMIDRPSEIAEGIRLAQRGAALGKDDAVTLARAGHALSHFTGDVESGVALLDKALALNPNLATAWFISGFLRIWRGDPEGAIERFERGMRLSPLDPEMFRMQAGMAMAHLLAKRFDVASSFAEKAIRELSGFLIVAAVIAASHALAGRQTEAEKAMHHVRKLDPSLRISNIKDWLPILRPGDLVTFADGLRKAGLPE